MGRKTTGQKRDLFLSWFRRLCCKKCSRVTFICDHITNLTHFFTPNDSLCWQRRWRWLKTSLSVCCFCLLLTVVDMFINLCCVFFRSVTWGTCDHVMNVCRVFLSPSSSQLSLTFHEDSFSPLVFHTSQVFFSHFTAISAKRDFNRLQGKDPRLCQSPQSEHDYNVNRHMHFCRPFSQCLFPEFLPYLYKIISLDLLKIMHT